MEFELRDNEKLDCDDEDLFDRRDLRKKKEKKRGHKQQKEMDEYTKESFKKMKEEIDELRKKEEDRTKELEDLKKKIDEQERRSTEADSSPEYTLGFDKDEYLNKGFIESAKWIKDVVSKNMIEKMNEERYRDRFGVLLLSKKSSSHLGIRTCARYNRGDFCPFGKCHSTHKPETNARSAEDSKNYVGKNTYFEHRQQKMNQQQQESQFSPQIQDRLGRRNESRLHSCTLCMEAFGSAFGHTVLNCPWILKNNWE